MNLEGRLLGNRYEIIEKVGCGGMATVYKAKCHVLNRYVAVKILRDEFTTDEEFIKRFAAEATAVASLSHPNIVAVYDVGHEGDLYYIVMELIKGKTLKEIILEEKGPLPWKWSVNIAIQVASALEVAHKNNIIHRDIKPHNIIITEDGIAKVTDFGIAKAVSNSTITAFGTTIGSVHYFSPEHAKGGITDYKSDLYSLGVVMYEMLTNKVPFDADTPVSVALKHMQEKPVEPKNINPNIPTAVNKIILKAMQKDANLRYSSSTEMLEDLRKALKDPEGNFVYIKDIENDFPTQRVSTMYDTELNKKEEKNGPENKRGTDDKTKKNSTKFKGLIIAVIIALLCCVALVLGIVFTKTKEVQVPNLVGKTIEEVQTILAELNVEYKIGEYQYSTEIEPGRVISQNPEFKENYNIKEKSTITVVVSNGYETTTVPKIVGLTEEEAIRALDAAKLKYEVELVTSPTVEAGYVTAQDIPENNVVNIGSVIKISVSTGTGIKQVLVPYVINKTQADAIATLEAEGLKVTVIENKVYSGTDGIVTEQSQSVGTIVDEGTTIIITVNKLVSKVSGKVVVNVKNITGGYTVTVKEPEKNNNVVNNTVGNSVSNTVSGNNTVSSNVVSNNTVDTNKTRTTPEYIYSTTDTTATVTIVVNGETISSVKTVDKNDEDYEYTFTAKESESVDIVVTITDNANGNTKTKSKQITSMTADVVVEIN